jgi:excisionase family DNA binding protein
MATTAIPPAEIPSEAEAKLAGETKQLLAPLLNAKWPKGNHSIHLTTECALKLPRPAIRLLAQILDEMSRGNAVKVIPIRAELTTQEAADLLNVSRPTLIQLLESGAVPFRKVGTHRRIRLETLITYKRKLDVERSVALAELSAYDQELGL